MFRRFLKKILEWLLGNKDKPFEYTHHAVLLVGTVLFFYAAAVNYYLGLANTFTVIALLILSFLIFIVWYLSRWQNQFKLMSIIFIALIIIVAIPINWMGNGGSNGPTFFVALGLLIYISGSFKNIGIYRRLGQLFCLLIPIPLIILENAHPELVFHYATGSLKQIDLTITFIIIGLFLIIMTESLSTRFKLEREKAWQLSEKLKALSEQDSLTGLYNRRKLDEQYTTWKQQGRIFSLALLDIDHFKNVNDQWGHNYGDKVLQSFAELLMEVAKQNNGLAIRFGGEEFILFLPLSLDETYQAITKTAQSLSEVSFQHGSVTFSVGISQDKTEGSQDELLKRADNLMYQAKNKGRNCICK